MKIAITGGAGRIGKACAAMALAEGHTVVSIDRIMPENLTVHENYSFIQADITDYAALENAFRGCDALIHQAAIPAPGRLPDHVVHNNNVTGSYNALRAAVEVGIQKICQASSVNATGLAYSRWPRFDYFPLDENHPTYSEEPYALSKWICEEQANSLARRYDTLTIASLRYHWVTPEAPSAERVEQFKHSDGMVKNLWAYTLLSAAARACFLALNADYKGHEVFYIVAPETMLPETSREMAQKYYPNVEIRGDFSGHQSFFNSSKAERLLGWKHE